MINIYPERFVICIFLLLIPILFTGADQDSVQQALDAWFAGRPESAAYNSIKNELYTLFSRAYTLTIPLTILFERLQEGASKRIPAQKLLKALEEEVERLYKILVMINEIDSLSLLQGEVSFFTSLGTESGPGEKGDEEIHTNLIHQLSIFNRSGISVRSMSSLFSLALETEKSKGAMFLVLHGLIKIPGLGNLDDEETTDLGTALLKSTLSPESYGTISSIYVKGRTYQLNYSTITEIVIDVLNRGGGLVQIEQEIIRRGRKR